MAVELATSDHVALKETYDLGSRQQSADGTASVDTFSPSAALPKPAAGSGPTLVDNQKTTGLAPLLKQLVDGACTAAVEWPACDFVVVR